MSTPTDYRYTIRVDEMMLSGSGDAVPIEDMARRSFERESGMEASSVRLEHHARSIYLIDGSQRPFLVCEFTISAKRRHRKKHSCVARKYRRIAFKNGY